MPSDDTALISPEVIPVEWKELTAPPLLEVSKILNDALNKNFEDVSVAVVDCPDLTKEPFGLAAKGLCGQERIVDAGGVPYLVPQVKREKNYDMRNFPKLANFEFSEQSKSALIIGAGAAPWTFLGRNAEMMVNLSVDENEAVVQNKTYISRTFDEDASTKLIALPESETKMSLLANLYLSEGLPGKVLEVRAKRRTGPENFVTCMRKALEEANPGHIALGGVFCATKGRLKIHVMPDFSETPLATSEDVDNWLKFYEMDSPFTNFSVFISRDPGMDLRVEHTHGHNISTCQGGHYHYDTTPENIEYIGYFNVAKKCYRFDRP